MGYTLVQWLLSWMATPSRWMEVGIQFLQCSSQRLWKGNYAELRDTQIARPDSMSTLDSLAYRAKTADWHSVLLYRTLLVSSRVWEHPVCCPWCSIPMKDMGEKTMPLEKAGKAFNVQVNPLGPWGSREFFIYRPKYLLLRGQTPWLEARVSNIRERERDI